MNSIHLVLKFSVAAVFLAAFLAFSFSIASVNGQNGYYVTFDQTGLDASATGTVVTINGVTYGNLPFSQFVLEREDVYYNYETYVSSTVSNMRFRLGTVSGPNSPIRVTEDTTVTGNYFTQYRLTVTSPRDSPGGEGWYDIGDFAYATLRSGTVNDGTGVRYVFTGWSGDASGTGLTSNPIAMNGPKAAIANWKTQYFITVSSSHDDPTHSAWVDAGSDFTASVTSPTEIHPNDYQWVCTGYGIDGSSVKTGTSYTFVNVQAPHKITFAWKREDIKSKFWIQVNSSLGSPPPSQWIDKGGSLTVSVTSPTNDDGAGTRYRCTGYRLDNGSRQTGASYTFTNVTADHMIEFDWVIQYRLVTDTDPSGLTTISGSEWYDASTVATTATAPTTVNSSAFIYTFSTWKKDGVAVSGNPISILMDAPHTATAFYTSSLRPTTGSLKIRVVDPNNTPVRGATVESTVQPGGQSQLSGTTDTNGYITFNSIQAGSYSFELFKGGYITSTKSVTVTADHTTTETVTLQFEEIVDLLIFVKDANNNPIAGANITSTSQPGAPLKGVTDSSGYATFLNLVPGNYSILVSKAGYGSSSQQVTVESEKVTTLTFLIQPITGSSTQAAMMPVSLWVYVVALLVLWGGVLTATIFAFRASARDSKREASQKPLN